MALSELLATWAEEIMDAWPFHLVHYGEQGVLYSDGHINDVPRTHENGYKLKLQWPFYEPGGGWHVVAPFRQTLEKHSTLLQVENLEWQRCELKDGTLITFSVCARYSVLDAVELYKTVDEPESAIQDAIRVGAAKAAIGTPDIEDFLSGSFLMRATNAARAGLKGWGVELEPMRVTNAVETTILSLIHDPGGADE